MGAAIMEVAGQGEPPGDPWNNDPGPLITPVDAVGWAVTIPDKGSHYLKKSPSPTGSKPPPGEGNAASPDGTDDGSPVKKIQQSTNTEENTDASGQATWTKWSMRKTR